MWMDGALMGCTFFVPPCPWANPGGELKLTFSFPFPHLISGWFLFGFFFLTPHARLGFTYLPAFRLPTYAPWIATSPIYLPAHLSTHLPTYSSICLHTHQPTYLCTYALNFHQGNDDTSL
jgi:hypothetical protein